MKNENKTKKQLLKEYKKMQTRLKELEAKEADRKQAEEALRDSEEEKTTILENLMELVVYRDKNMATIWGSKSVSEWHGLTPDEIVGRVCYKARYGKNKPCENCPVYESLITGKAHERESESPDGKIWYVRCNPVRNKAGNIIGTIEISCDITERKRAEEALLESEEKLRLMIKNSLDVIFRIEMDKGYTFMSPSVEQLTGYHPDDYYNDPEFWRKITHPDDIPKVEEMFAAIIEGKDPPMLWELQQFKKDGNPIHLEFTTIAIRDEADKIVALEGVARDITDRKMAEEELRKLKDELEIKVVEKTKELQERLFELERYQDATVDRELRMKERRDKIE